MIPESPAPDEQAHVKPVTQEFERPAGYGVRPVQHEDVSSLEPILRQWVRDRETAEQLDAEIAAILSQIDQSIDHDNGRKYVVAQADDNSVIGVMGITEADDDMKQYAKTAKPAEIVNAFVDQDHRGHGVGKALIEALEQQATKNGNTELIVNSGPRYRESGYGFYNKLFGEPVAIMKDEYGPGADAPVWRKEVEASMATASVGEKLPAGKVELRTATEGDTEFARNVHHRAYHDVVVAQFGEWDEAKQDGFFDSAWANPGFEIIVCDGEPCGYSRIENLPTEIKAHELVLLPEFQGRGIGTAFLHKVQEMAQERGVPVKLQVLRANRAAELYEKVGFKPTGKTATHTEMEWKPLPRA